MSEFAELAVELQPASRKGFLQVVEELLAEELAQGFDRQEKADLLRGPPLLPVGRQSPGGHNTVNMGMVLEALVPTVQYGQETDARPEPFRVGCHLGQ